MTLYLSSLSFVPAMNSGTLLPKMCTLEKERESSRLVIVPFDEAGYPSVPYLRIPFPVDRHGHGQREHPAQVLPGRDCFGSPIKIGWSGLSFSEPKFGQSLACVQNKQCYGHFNNVILL